MSCNQIARSQIEKKFHDFVQEHYAEMPRSIVVPETLKQLNRSVWYCNYSGIPIAELQSLNVDRSQIVSAIKLDSKHLADQYFLDGYTDYNTYYCGHSIYLIYYLFAIFDLINSNFASIIKLQNVENAGEYADRLIYTIDFCPICKEKISNRKEMYYIDNSLSTGKYIPKKYLSFVKSEFVDGDILDTVGYRGIGFYILNGNCFTPIKHENYYPVLEMELLNRFGYIKLLTNLQKVSLWNKPYFNKLYITDNIYFNTMGFHDKENLDSSLLIGTYTKSGYDIYVFASDEKYFEMVDLNRIQPQSDLCFMISTNISICVNLLKSNDMVILPKTILNPSILNYFLVLDNGVKYVVNFKNGERMIIGNSKICITRIADDAEKFDFSLEE